MDPIFQKQFDSAIDDYAFNNQYRNSMVPAHTHNGTDSLRIDFNSLENKTIYILNRIVASGTNTATGTAIGGDYVMPYNGLMEVVGATVDTAGTTGDTTINIKKNGTSILLTKITINSTQKTSRTATTQPVLDPSKIAFNIGDILTFDVDTISTTPAKGLTIFINVIQL